jgi:hypothetical protein
LAAQSPDAYADAIRSIIEHPETRERKVAAALVTASQHNWPEIAADYLRLYKELHERVQGNVPENATPPRFVSTPGDYFGRETVHP